MSFLAKACWFLPRTTLGQFGEAEKLYRRCLEVSERTLGAEHPETGTFFDWRGRFFFLSFRPSKLDYEPFRPILRTWDADRISPLFWTSPPKKI